MAWQETKSRRKKVLSLLISLALLAFALWFFFRLIRDVNPAEIWVAVRSRSPLRLLLGFLFCWGSYACLTGYDALGVAFVKRKLSYWKIALASIVGFSFSHNMGHPLITGGYPRYRLYSRWGLKPSEIIKVILCYSMNFWMGFLFIGGLVLNLHWVEPPSFLTVWLPIEGLWGLVLWGLLILCALLCTVVPKPVRIRSFEIQLPSLKILLAQVAVSSLDFFLASQAIFWLLPQGHPFHVGEVLGIYIFSFTFAFISQVPGGLGVLESAMLLYFKDKIPIAEITATLILFRIFYYFIPFVVGIGLYARFEVFKKKPKSDL